MQTKLTRRQAVRLTGAGLLSGLAFSQPALAKLNPGIDYREVREIQSIAPHSKQVTEVFFYGCPHCYNLQNSLYEWLATKPTSVHFERMPAVLNNQSWIFMARVYYAAEDLGIIEQSNRSFFDALHRDRLPLSNLGNIAEFHSEFGVTTDQFVQSFNSFKVDQAVRRAQRRTQAYGIEGVPSLIVNGRYLTDLTLSGGHQPLWQNVNNLLNLEA
ncbi:thiol:disulfide interchange protein DsbA [Thiomicrospira aerophila AL3]|uniref:Thiol:disulfide interchange protein n=1 Tax=Thiomicrospira aerophila AL3 TaxID=717772 RepID=W0DZ50_9GAMM|nr:thiol:disulfide interchange protein DsbA/DsbL [Thiomicrospira aerophila]AHF02136.1 thiol:disulfide interchange protein DsbA [Thiomicrospira aerophila AL3]